MPMDAFSFEISEACVAKDQVGPLVAESAVRLGHDWWPDSEESVAWLVIDMDSHHWGHDAEARQFVDHERVEQNFGAVKGWRPWKSGHPIVSGCHWAEAQKSASDTLVHEHHLVSNLDYYLVEVSTVTVTNATSRSIPFIIRFI